MAEIADKLLHPINHPSAWRASDLAGDDRWIVHVSPDEVDELVAATDLVERQSKRAAEFERQDFPLPRFSATLARVLEELEHGRGFVVIRGLPVDAQNEERASKLFWGINCYLGRALRQHPSVNPKGFKDDLIAHILNQGLDPTQPNVHGSTTSAEQMPHCDPADLVALLCVRPAKVGGISSMVSAMSIYNELLAKHPEFLDILYRGFHHDLRNQQARDVGTPVTPARIPVFSYFAGRLSCNFNYKTILTAQQKTGVALTDLERAALDKMLEIAVDPAMRFDMRLESGDLQLANNYVLLHSRDGWIDDDPERRRLMLRLWLKAPNARPLAPGFAGGYISGAYYDVGAQATATAA